MSAYAIIKSGGKQYRVQSGDVIDVECLENAEADQTIEFQDVLFFTDGKKAEIGAPTVKATVKGKVLANVRGPKVICYRYRKRKDSSRKVGHRQDHTRVKITEVGV